MTTTYYTIEEARQNKAYLQALTELVYQLADDDLIVSHRGSEWLGLGPHIEEDVAFSSISQDTMGHAAMFYELLEELGEGRADDLAHLRMPDQFRNAIITERLNGEGHYRETPNYDWAYAIIRNYAYEVFKKIRLDALAASSFVPLSEMAAKITREQFFHLYHWQVWIDELAHSTEEARTRLNRAVARTWEDVATLFDLGPQAEAIVSFGLIESADEMKHKFLGTMQEKLTAAGLDWLGEPIQKQLTGREGSHTGELAPALQELGEVYSMDAQANW